MFCNSDPIPRGGIGTVTSGISTIPLPREGNVGMAPQGIQGSGKNKSYVSWCSPFGLCLALISAAHGLVRPRIVQRVGQCGAVVHVGDIDNRGVLSRLRRFCQRVLADRGNYDTPKKWPASKRRFLHQLPRRSTAPWVLNPGAAGRSRTVGSPSRVNLDVTTRG